MSIRVWLVLLITVSSLSPALAQTGPVQLSFLPNGRSGTPNTPVTFFGTVINSGSESLDCAPRFGGNIGGLPTGVSGQLRFFPWDGTVITGSANQTVSIPAGGRQDYVVEATFDGEFTGVVSNNFRCTNGEGTPFDAAQLPAVNDLAFNIRNTPGRDIILINATLSNDGVSRVGETGPRGALMTVAAINIGQAESDLVVEAGITTFSNLHDGLDISVCETDAGGACISDLGRTVAIANWAANETKLFAVRVRVPEAMGIPFYPDLLRIVLLVRPTNPSTPTGLNQPSEVNLSGSARLGIEYTSAAAAARPSTETRIEQRMRIQIDSRCADAGFDFGGRIRLSSVTTGPDDDGNVNVFGDLRVRDFSLQEYSQLFSGQFPQLTLNGQFNANIYGSDDDDEVPVDTQLPLNYDFDPGVGMQISWEADPSFVNDFQENGRVRCAASPAPENEPTVEDFEASAAGLYASIPAVGGEAGQVNIDGSRLAVSIAGEQVDLGLDFEPLPGRDESLDQTLDELFTKMVRLRFAGAGEIGPSVAGINAVPGDIIGYFIPRLYRDTGQSGIQVVCADLILADYPRPGIDQSFANRDAGSYQLVREGLTLSEAETEICNR